MRNTHEKKRFEYKQGFLRVGTLIRHGYLEILIFDIFR